MAKRGFKGPGYDLLPLLKKCKNEDLDPLVSCLTQNEGITSQLKQAETYKKHYPDHKMYVNEIADQILKLGQNLLPLNGRSGSRVTYKEIVCDVAKKLKINFDKKMEINFIEQEIISRVIEKALEKMNEEEKRRFIDALGEDYKLLPIAINFCFMPSKISRKILDSLLFRVKSILANALGKPFKGQGVRTNAKVDFSQHIYSLPGSIDSVIKSLLPIFDLASPAYRVIVPCVAHIAMLRQKYALLDKGADLTEDLKISKPKKQKSSVHANRRRASLPSAV